MGATPHNKTRYAAFISYAHADEVMAARLHKALETYAVPRHLRAQGKTTKPVFRDVAELTAAHSLSEKIRDAVKGSRVLIVLCSPAAKASHWVNEEIRLFRELHGEGAILSAIIEGTPETAFPDALIEGGREPLAAALGTDKAGFKLGVTQLAAGMLGTGLDDLVQRESKRRNRLMGTGLAASLALSGIMGFATLQAVEARNEAQLERTESEALLEYMVKDLKVKLEPVGRLELLEGVGRKAIDYYDKKDIADLSDDNLRLLAAARQVIAQVALDAGRMEGAQSEIEASAGLTKEVLGRNPDDTDAIFAHAQSEYWVGAYYRKQGKLAEMETPWREYDRLAQILYTKDPTNFDWVMEAAWGQNNLGNLAREYHIKSKAVIALENYTRAIELFKEARKLKPDSKLALTELLNAMSGKAPVLLALGTADEAREGALERIRLYSDLIEKYPNDINLKSNLYLAEVDFNHDFFLYLDFKKKADIAQSLNNLLAISEYDRKNIKNTNNYLKLVFDVFEHLEFDELLKHKFVIEKMLKNLPDNHQLNNDYYQKMLQILIIKLDIYENEKSSAINKLKKLTNQYFSKNDFEINDWKLTYDLFLLSQEIGDFKNEKALARKFLELTSARTDLNYPTILNHKINAFLALGKCDDVFPLAQNLKARGYTGIPQDILRHCSSP